MKTNVHYARAVVMKDGQNFASHHQQKCRLRSDRRRVGSPFTVVLKMRRLLHVVFSCHMETFVVSRLSDVQAEIRHKWDQRVRHDARLSNLIENGISSVRHVVSSHKLKEFTSKSSTLEPTLYVMILLARIVPRGRAQFSSSFESIVSSFPYDLSSSCVSSLSEYNGVAGTDPPCSGARSNFEVSLCGGLVLLLLVLVLICPRVRSALRDLRTVTWFLPTALSDTVCSRPSVRGNAWSDDGNAPPIPATQSAVAGAGEAVNPSQQVGRSRHGHGRLDKARTIRPRPGKGREFTGDQGPLALCGRTGHQTAWLLAEWREQPTPKATKAKVAGTSAAVRANL